MVCDAERRPGQRESFGRLADRMQSLTFLPPPALRNGHLQTLVGRFWPRRHEILNWPCEAREFVTEPDVRVRAYCHWQPRRQARATVVLLHGFEGSARAPYMLGAAEKAVRAGFNVVRMNARNCGETEGLCRTLYHAGLTADLRAVIAELIGRDRLGEVFVVGFSMGGNQALKLAGELGDAAPREWKGLVAVSPPIDVRSCTEALGRGANRLYETYFLNSIKASLRRKQRHFPDLFPLDEVRRLRNLAEYGVYTLPHIGFRDLAEYYEQASARRRLAAVRVPTLIIHAEDDPLIPFDPFREFARTPHPYVTLVGPRHGGHVGFWGLPQADEDRYWAENRAVEFCRLLASPGKRIAPAGRLSLEALEAEEEYLRCA
jgi:uncharacterized protein